MPKLRKLLLAALATATVASTGVLMPIAEASATHYYGHRPGYGYYGGPYYGGYRPQHCKWFRIPYRWNHYGQPIAWRKVKRCW